MSLIYITGPSCAGKSTLCAELKSRGYEAYDEADVCAWYDPKTGLKVKYPDEFKERPPDWESHHDMIMSEKKIKELRNRSKKSTIFVFAFCGNETEMTDKYFDKVLCLEIDEETLTTRLRSRAVHRTGYGKDPDQMANVRECFKPKLDRHRNSGTTMVDATQPVEIVADYVLQDVSGAGLLRG